MSDYGYTPGRRADHTAAPNVLAADQHPDQAHAEKVAAWERDLDHDLDLDERDRFTVDLLSERGLARRAAA